MKKLAALFALLFDRLGAIEARVKVIESRQTPGETVALSGNPQINR